MPQPHVVLIHGFGAHPLVMTRLAWQLRRAGFVTLNVRYPSWRDGIAGNVARIHARIAPWIARVDGPVHFVGHSMGGLLIRAYLARYRPDALGRVVMLGSPNGGSEIAELLHRARLHLLILGRSAGALRIHRTQADISVLGMVDYELGVIAGNRPSMATLPNLIFGAPNDGKVSVAATHVAGETDHLVLPLSHTMMVYTQQVADQVNAFLRNGTFLR